MARTIATADRVSRQELLEFVRPRHHAVLMTTRASGAPQLSPVTCGVDDDGRIVISTYPERAKAVNVRRNPQVSMCVLSDDFGGAWVQVDGTAEVIDLPDSVEPLVEYYRNIAGEHPDWAEYRSVMVSDRRVLMAMAVEKVYGAKIR